MILESVEMPAPENTTIRRAAPSSPAASRLPVTAVRLAPSILVRVAAPPGHSEAVPFLEPPFTALVLSTPTA